MSEEVAKYDVKPFEISMDDVKKYIAPGATDKELFVFMGIAKAYGLNPMKREIHFIKRKWKDENGNWKERGDTVVGYEIYIKRAETTGLLDGWECNTAVDGKKAFVTIYRKDRSKPFKWEVDRAEFDTGQSTWKKMPGFMLKKVAIAQGFRLCFPEHLGGMPYMPEEIAGTTSEQLPADKIEDKKDTEFNSSMKFVVKEYDEPSTETKKPSFVESLNSEYERIGPERFYEVLASFQVEKAEQVTDRDLQIKIFKAMKEVGA
jgi:phage recombination protein Bet